MKNSLPISDSTTTPSSSTYSNTRPEGKSQPPHGTKSGMARRMVVMLVLMALFIVAIGVWKVWQIKAGMAMAIFGMSVMVGPALGPTLGGYLTDNFGDNSAN